MTTLADIERVLATLSPEQKAKLRTLVDSRTAAPVVALIELAAERGGQLGHDVDRSPEPPKPAPRKAAPVRDLVGPWVPPPLKPKPYDPLGAWR